MASNIEFIEFISSQLEGLGYVSYRKMFGDYIIYLDEKPIILVCDNIAYIKRLPELSDLMSDAESGIPYEGAKEHYILDVDHKTVLQEAVKKLWKFLPYPSQKQSSNTSKITVHPFRKLPNVGVQTEQDLLAMGYTSIDSLKEVNADDLYQKECDLRGCSIDRCQLYLYRALEYYINSENPDIEKCKWWYWKDDYFYPSPCGARCVNCKSFPKECKGCRNIKGKVFWTQYTGDTVCPIWKCCSEQKRKNCGNCPDLPCVRFMKDPTISDEENEANLKKMIDNLSEFVK